MISLAYLSSGQVSNGDNAFHCDLLANAVSLSKARLRVNGRWTLVWSSNLLFRCWFIYPSLGRESSLSTTGAGQHRYQNAKTCFSSPILVNFSVRVRRLGGMTSSSFQRRRPLISVGSESNWPKRWGPQLIDSNCSEMFTTITCIIHTCFPGMRSSTSSRWGMLWSTARGGGAGVIRIVPYGTPASKPFT